MEFRRARFGKRADRYPRNNRNGQQNSRSEGSRYSRDSGGGSRYGGASRFGSSSRFGSGSRYGGGSRNSRGSDGNRRVEMHDAVCGDCGNECQIPFKPRDSRPVYCRECFQSHNRQESNDSGFDRNDRGSRYTRDSNRGSRYSRDSGSRFEKDRTPIHSRDDFRQNRYKQNDFVNQKKKSKYQSDDSDIFYSTLRSKLFKILGGKRCSSCGFEDERALGFGHIDDAESFDYGQRGGSVSSWEKYIAEPGLARKSLHILCLNCNQLNQK